MIASASWVYGLMLLVMVGAVLNKITRTTVYESGEFAGETMSVTTSRNAIQPDGTVVVSTVVNTRSTVGDEPCEYRMVLRLVDYEAVVYQVTTTCGA